MALFIICFLDNFFNFFNNFFGTTFSKDPLLKLTEKRWPNTNPPKKLTSKVKKKLSEKKKNIIDRGNPKTALHLMLFYMEGAD